MAKGFQIVRSEDATTIIVAGDKAHPEPSSAIIRFPGGNVEVSRTSDGAYWAHIGFEEFGDDGERSRFQIVDSRIDYDAECGRKNGIPDVPDADHIKHIAVRFERERPAADLPLVGGPRRKAKATVATR